MGTEGRCLLLSATWVLQFFLTSLPLHFTSLAQTSLPQSFLRGPAPACVSYDSFVSQSFLPHPSLYPALHCQPVCPLCPTTAPTIMTIIATNARHANVPSERSMQLSSTWTRNCTGRTTVPSNAKLVARNSTPNMPSSSIWMLYRTGLQRPTTILSHARLATKHSAPKTPSNSI